jgi:N-methylhydantoinase A
MWRVGSDVGGTFTDVVAWDEDSGALAVAKRPTRPDHPAETILAGLATIGARAPVEQLEIGFLGHATTMVTNAVIEGNGAKTALVTTRGFRDVLEIKRLSRNAKQLYDPLCRVGAPLIPRRFRFEIDERVTWRGEVRRAPFPRDVRELARVLRDVEVDAVAVCLLFSFLRPQHEELVGRILREELPGVSVTLSCEIDRQIGEYERSSLTALTASVRPLLERYVTRFQAQLQDAAVTAPVYFMKSNGGVTTPELMGRQAALSMLSGPAGGVIASQYLGSALSLPNIISADMGGTSFDVAVIADGAPVRSAERLIHDLPLRLPVLDITTIGAGGGSLASVDDGGALRVGPRSAGSVPGPACYGRGGTEPTVTDANVVLGILNPDHLLDGSMDLDAALARKACEGVASRLGLDLGEAAAGIRTIVNAAMVGAIRTITVGVGRDPREFALVAYGGAGPLHAVELAASLGIEWVVIPPHPGCHSAFGLLVTDLVHDYAQTLLALCTRIDCHQAEAEFRQLEGLARADLAAGGLPAGRVVLIRSLGMRYTGQNASLGVPLQSASFTAKALDAAVSRFHDIHRATFGFNAGDEEVEVVELRLQAVGTIDRPAPSSLSVAATPESVAPTAYRDVLVNGRDAEATPVYLRPSLGPGVVVEGPCIIEQLDSTAFVPRDWVVTCEPTGCLVIGHEPWSAGVAMGASLDHTTRTGAQ